MSDAQLCVICIADRMPAIACMGTVQDTAKWLVHCSPADKVSAPHTFASQQLVLVRPHLSAALGSNDLRRG